MGDNFKISQAMFRWKCDSSEEVHKVCVKRRLSQREEKGGLGLGGGERKGRQENLRKHETLNSNILTVSIISQQKEFQILWISFWWIRSWYCIFLLEVLLEKKMSIFIRHICLIAHESSITSYVRSSLASV